MVTQRHALFTSLGCAMCMATVCVGKFEMTCRRHTCGPLKKKEERKKKEEKEKNSNDFQMFTLNLPI